MTIATRSLRAGGREVPLLAGPGAIGELERALADISFEGRLFVVADEYAYQTYKASLGLDALKNAPVLLLDGQEASKTLETVSRVWDWLVEQGAQRRDALVAFGGGVICDLVGFAAACYLRGIGLINVPTTLLAQVDASVGGKTGVNHDRGKNLIGAFYQPLVVVADTSLLGSLSPRAFAAGMAEVVKMAMILDADLFERLERGTRGSELDARAADALAPVVARSIELKADIVERDERESGDRMLLNYGHTVGHALEAGAGYGTLLHGEAVAVGMQAAAFIAERLGMLERADAQRQTQLLRAFDLPLSWPAHRDDVLARLSFDKKRAGSQQRWILADRIGAGHIDAGVPADVVFQAVSSVTSK